MAFDIAGLGGTFAAGFLEGAQGAQKQREVLASQREKEYLQTYTDLIKSGEWEPVDTSKGVPDGGVLRVGNIGMLKQRSMGVDPLKQMQIANYASLIKSREPQVGESRTVPTSVVIGEGDKSQMGHGVKVERWDGEKWVETETVPKGIVERSPGGYTTYIDRDTQKVMHVPKGERPPDNAVPAPTFVSGEHLAVRRAGTRAEEYGMLAREAAKERTKFSTYALMPRATEGVVANAQDAFVKSSVEMARYAAMEQAVKDGRSEREVFDVGLKAAEAARQKAESEIGGGKPVEEGSPVSSAVKSWIVDKYNWATDAVQEELARRAEAKRAEQAVESEGPKFIGKIPPKVDKQVVIKPIPPRPKQKTKKPKFKSK